jgi:Glycosyl hydrolase catalytic core
VRAGRRVLLAVTLGVLTALAAQGCSSGEPKVQAPPHPKPIVWGFAENLQRDPPTISEKVAEMKRIGARMVRFDIGLEPAEAAAVRKARAAGLGVLGVITGGSRDPEVYAARAERIVRRYAPLGVHHYEIWNEPNLVQTWPTADDPDRATTEYMALVRAAYPRIKAADPRSVVLVGALSRREYVGGRPNDWVEAMYKKGLKGNFDAISVHPYTDPDLPGTDSTAASAWLQMTGPWDDRAPSVRESMVRNGDGAKTVWITEFAAPTGGDLGFPVTEQRQAEILRRAVDLAQSYPWLGGFLWYGLRDSVSGTEQYGLLRADGSRKPAYVEFASAIRRTRGRPAGG